MKIAYPLLAAGLVAAAVGAATAQGEGEHVVMPQSDIEWQPGPPSVPEGAEVAVLYGDPAAEGLFAMRLKLPSGYHIAPHTHPKEEVVTILSGTLKLGMGETADEAATEALAGGDFFAMAPGMPHYVYSEGETVLQLNSNGPWAIEYLNPEDDPRQTQ